MRRIAIAIALLAALCWAIPAQATTLLNLPVTTAISMTAGQVFQIRPGPGGQWLPATLTVQATLTGGTGGTSVDVYLQTSLDGQLTWTDVAEFHFTTAARLIWTLESSIIAAPVQVTAPTDGAMTVSTALSGVFGNYWRVKYVTVGTYTTTNLRVDAISNGLTTLP